MRAFVFVLGKKLTGSNKTYDEWQSASGAFASYMEINEKSVDKALKEFIGNKSKMRDIFKYANPVKLAEEFASIFEQATRLSMYSRSQLNGATALEAAFESREGTLDFGRSGKQGKIWNKYIPFFNASIQGTDKLVRAFVANPKTMFASILFLFYSINAKIGLFFYSQCNFWNIILLREAWGCCT